MNALIASIGVGVLRNISGWVNTATADGKIQSYELIELGKTTLRIGIYGTIIHYGFNISEGMVAAGIAFFADIVIEQVRKLTKKA